MKTIEVLGTPITATTYEEFTHHCHDLIRRGGTWAVDLSNTQIVTMRRHDSDFRRITSRFDFFLPDGMPLIWCLNRGGAELKDRVYGPKFMLHCMLNSPARFKHYLLGGSADCLEHLIERLVQKQPALQVVGTRSGYFQPQDQQKILDEINHLSPDYVWVGLGTPKQQEWIYQHKLQIKRGILFAVGFAFDVNAGTKKDAPNWMQQSGLTWLFRMLSEPRRLVTRYLKYNTLFLFYLTKSRLFGSR